MHHVCETVKFCSHVNLSSLNIHCLSTCSYLVYHCQQWACASITYNHSCFFYLHMNLTVDWVQL